MEDHDDIYHTEHSYHQCRQDVKHNCALHDSIPLKDCILVVGQPEDEHHEWIHEERVDHRHVVHKQLEDRRLSPHLLFGRVDGLVRVRVDRPLLLGLRLGRVLEKKFPLFAVVFLKALKIPLFGPFLVLTLPAKVQQLLLL